MKNTYLTLAALMWLGTSASAEQKLNDSPFDLTLVGTIKWQASLARIPISLVRLFKNDLSVNFIRTLAKDTFDEIPEDEQIILKNPDKRPGKVALFTDIVWVPNKSLADFVPDESFIKIAYSMLEGTAIPKQWVTILNEKFDLVVVPDEYYQSVYSNSGVRIPIFVCPLGIDFEDSFKEPIKKSPSKPFVFGSSGTFIPRKNYLLLINAFRAEFGNDSSVQLKIHGRNQQKQEIEQIHECIKDSKNIEIINSVLTSADYDNFLKSLDCYVLLSKGEGFSLTPREALAMGKPCIISNNTGHETIAKTNYVYAVPSNIAEPAYYIAFKDYVGYNFNCSVDDARKALREVYSNYALYLEKAQEGRKWVTQYLWSNRKAEFLNLIKPRKVIFGNEDKVTSEFIMTKSEKLFNKYTQLIQK